MNADRVQTSKGWVRGNVESDCRVFYNIQHSKIPARFAAPEETDSWTHVHDATRRGKVCVQITVPGVSVVPKAKTGPNGLPENMAEDALNLNVWTPAGAGPRNRRPVMVWVHGGAFHTGSGALPMYDGRRLCVSQEVVVVTINYRLGVLGFLYNPEGGVPANLGLRDQIAALQWVQREISSFGGDPEKVTVFGQSAGAMSITTLMASPLAKGLFRAAILQSGAGNSVQTPQQANKCRALIAAELGVSVDKMTAEYLRTVPLKLLRDAEMRMLPKSRENLMPFQPTITQDFPHPLSAIAAGASRDVSVMSGVTREEYNLFMIALKGKFARERTVRNIEKRLSTTYPALSYDDAKGSALRIVDATSSSQELQVKSDAELYSQALGQYLFTIPHERLLDAHQGRSYSYRFDWRSPMKGMGAAHAVEIPFVFHTHVHPLLRLFAGKGPEADALSKIMMDSWGAFARDLSPETKHTGRWPSHDAVARPTVVFGAENKGRCTLRSDVHRELLPPWQGVLQARL